MKKTLIIAVLSLLVLPFSALNAAGNSKAEEDALFGVNLSSVTRALGTQISRFDFETVDVEDPEEVEYWKLRIWCDEGIKVGLTAEADQCGTLQTIATSTPPAAFSVFLTNQRNERIHFSFKLKAYDKEGNWLHSEKESFLWK